MKCPYCDVDMLEGYLQGAPILWSTHYHPNFLIPGKNEKYALYLKIPFITPNSVPSFCCPKCKKIIVDSSDYPNNLD